MTITQLCILDWYDDIITSVVSFENGMYIFNCVQKNFASGEKTYYCVKIDEELYIQLQDIIEKKTLTERDWNMINLIFKNSNTNENVFLLRTVSLSVGLDITFNKVRDSDITDIKFPFDISSLCNDPGIPV